MKVWVKAPWWAWLFGWPVLLSLAAVMLIPALLFGMVYAGIVLGESLGLKFGKKRA